MYISSKHFIQFNEFIRSFLESNQLQIDANNTIRSDKASYQLQFKRNFLSLMLESISEYIRIIFDLHPSFITFDIISCGSKIHSQTSITKSDYIRTLERFLFINGIENSTETKFVEAMERFLLELPSDFYNSHKYSSPFNSHIFSPITHILFIARNQTNIKPYKYLISNEIENQQINFTLLCRTAKIRNHSIKKVYILKYNPSDKNTENTNCKWNKTLTLQEEECLSNKEYNNIINLQWTKLPTDVNDPFVWSDWITLNIILITPSKLNDTSRLLMKFINKKKIATLRANYKKEISENYYLKCKYDK